jgi:hypothetical protein
MAPIYPRVANQVRAALIRPKQSRFDGYSYPALLSLLDATVTIPNLSPNNSYCNTKETIILFNIIASSVMPDKLGEGTGDAPTTALETPITLRVGRRSKHY